MHFWNINWNYCLFSRRSVYCFWKKWQNTFSFVSMDASDIDYDIFNL